MRNEAREVSQGLAGPEITQEEGEAFKKKWDSDPIIAPAQGSPDPLQVQTCDSRSGRK